MKVVLVFTALFGEVCAPFNISVPVVGSSGAVNGTNVTYPSPSPSVVMSSGGWRKRVELGSGWLGSLVLVVAVGLSVRIL